MKKVLLLVVITTVLIGACRKEDNSDKQTTHYTPMQVGDYWIYKTYKIDTQGNETDLNRIDSTFIETDTLIRNNTYHVLRTNANYGPHRLQIIRDSAGYIVNHKGERIFSDRDFTNIIREKYLVISSDTVGLATWRMERINGAVSVPAGTFDDVLNVKETVTFTPQSGFPSPREFKKYCAPNIGRILDSWGFFSTTDIYERRLIRYHIN